MEVEERMLGLTGFNNLFEMSQNLFYALAMLEIQGQAYLESYMSNIPPNSGVIN